MGRIAALCFLAAVLLWLPSLRVPFVWDDEQIVGQELRGLRNHSFLWSHGGGYFRPVTTLFFGLDWALWYQRPWGYHLTNLLLHAANGALVAVLLGVMGCSSQAALLGGLLFAVHPVHVESVAWVAGRTDLVCCLFLLLSLICFALWLREDDPRGLILSLLFALFSAGAKEVGVSLILILPLWWWAWRRGRGFLVVLGGTLALGGLLSWLRWPALRGLLFPALREWGPWSITSRLLRAHWFYLKRLFVPVGLSPFVGELPQGWWVMPVSGLILLALGWWLARSVRRGRPREALACSVWVFGLLPSLGVVLGCLAVTLVANRYLYVPSLALCLILPPLALRHRAGVLGLWGGIALCAALSLARLGVWADPERLWRETVERNPGFAIPKQQYAKALAARGRPRQAIEVLRQALRDPYQAALGTQGGGRWEQVRSLSALALGVLYREIGNHERSRRWLLTSTRFLPYWQAYHELALLELQGPEPPSRSRLIQAWRLLNAALSIYEPVPEVHWDLARVYWALGAHRAARRHLVRILEIDPRSGLARRAAALLSRWGP